LIDAILGMAWQDGKFDSINFKYYLRVRFIIYKQTIFKVHLPFCGITAHATMPGWLEHSTISFVTCVDPNDILIWGLNPGPFSPLDHNYSALFESSFYERKFDGLKIN
jgi:hypothetical protein